MASNLADFDVLTRRDEHTISVLSRRLAEPRPLLVPDLGHDIGDLPGLAAVVEHLFSPPREEGNR
jgi:hypothetical protein